MGKNTNLCLNTSSFTPRVKIPALWFSDVCLSFDRIKFNGFGLDFSITKFEIFLFQREDITVFVRIRGILKKIHK